MRISRFGVLFCVVAGMFSATVDARAFDPQQVFKEERPSFEKIWRFFTDKRKEGHEEEAVDALRYAAENGSNAARWKLGRMYQTGDGVAQSQAQAFEFYKQMADNYGDMRPGTPEWQLTGNAMLVLGRYYLTGLPEAGVPVNPAEAQVMFTTAATYFGLPDAQYELARLYLDSGTAAANGIKAARMLKAAADNGHVGAEAMLGNMLFDGQYLRRDPVRGLILMMRARDRASVEDATWISPMQEEAFALASETERRAAIEALKNGGLSN